jgi:hypothetical protein
MVAGVLFHHKSQFGLGGRVAVDLLLVLSFLAPLWASWHFFCTEYSLHLLVAERPDQSPRWVEWCNTPNPLTKGLCFLPEEDRMHAIEFLIRHTRPGQRLYSGVPHHDRIVANDNLIYFATQCLPATHWSHFDPGQQTRADIQTQMIGELERKQPAYVVLDAEFDDVREPNESANSSGVTLLDGYIRSQYRLAANFGTISVLQPIDPAEP